MNGPERRQTPRTTLARHAYINIEPNNGGIVLNVSDGGLCFYSFDPVPRNGTIRFWFSGHNPPIEADGTPAWTDETQKTGLRFTALPAEAREKIRDWMGHPTMPLAADEGSAPASSLPGSVPGLGGHRTRTKVVSGGSASLAVGSPQLEIPKPVSGFSWGLGTGILVSVVVVALFSFINHHREFGESLIRAGERFATTPRAQTLIVSAASPAVLPATQLASTAPRVTTPTTRAVLQDPPMLSLATGPSTAERSEKVVPRPEKLAPQPLAHPTESQPWKVDFTTPATVTANAVNAAGDVASYVSTGAKAPAIAAALAILSTPPPTAQPMAAEAGGSDLSGKLGTAATVEPANQPDVHTEGSRAGNADSTRELYFEVGRFKDVLQAHDETDKLAQLGFPATAVAKGHLWTSSFHVLVGPYPDEEQAKAIHENLVSSGFKPRPFEKGSRTFTILSSLTLNGGRAPEGDYTISWESYIGDANVKFARSNSVVATADGKWVKRDVKYPRDAYVYRRNADGSRTLLEIHFGGMRQALVFGKAM
jgi:hypothetical protein